MKIGPRRRSPKLPGPPILGYERRVCYDRLARGRAIRAPTVRAYQYNWLESSTSSYLLYQLVPTAVPTVRYRSTYGSGTAAVMSLFLDFPCLLSGCSKVISAAWCVVEPICAFSTNDHCISFYLEEGVSLERCRILRKSDATAIAWHPTAKVIAAGWGDGSISVWDLSPLSSSEVSPRDLADTLSSTCIFTDSSGQAPIRTVMWNPSATRLVSANNSGAILIWKVKTLILLPLNPGEW